MQLLILRHAIALDREVAQEQHVRDAARPLTPVGKRKMRTVARGIEALVDSIDIIATSPLLRAVQTADVLARRFPKAARAECGALRPNFAVASLPTWLRQQTFASTIAIVGHEPDLSGFIAWATSGRLHRYVKLKKAGACLLEFDERIAKGKAVMHWLLTAEQLRVFGRQA